MKNEESTNKGKYKIVLFDRDYKEIPDKYRDAKFADFIHVKDRTELLHKLNTEKKIDLLLIDMYSKIDEKNNEEDSIEIKTYIDTIIKQVFEENQKIDIDARLNLLQNIREDIRNKMSKIWYPNGIKDIEWLFNFSDKDIYFPVALFSRYGRVLLTSEQLLPLQNYGIYFAWKEKDLTSSIYGAMINREQDCMEEIIKIHKRKVNEANTKLNYIKNNLENEGKKIEKLFLTVTPKFEIAFLATTITLALYNIRFMLREDIKQVFENSFGEIALFIISISVLLTATIVFILKYVLKNNKVDYDNIYKEMNEIVSTIIKTNKKGE